MASRKTAKILQEKVDKKIEEPEHPAPVEEPISAADEPTPDEPKAPSPKINRDKSVKAVNNGPRFVINLAGYGYGGAWPNKAVYTIPMGLFMDCVTDGRDLALVA